MDPPVFFSLKNGITIFIHLTFPDKKRVTTLQILYYQPGFYCRVPFYGFASIRAPKPLVKSVVIMRNMHENRKSRIDRSGYDRYYHKKSPTFVGLFLWRTEEDKIQNLLRQFSDWVTTEEPMIFLNEIKNYLCK
jgi:hypothetical protein